MEFDKILKKIFNKYCYINKNQIKNILVKMIRMNYTL